MTWTKQNFLFFFNRYWRGALIVALSAVFFICASSFNFFLQRPSFYFSANNDFIKFSSPDETANYVFAKLYAQESTLYLIEKYDIVAKDIIRPRSIRSDNGVLKPMSFLGMPIVYGSAGKIFTVASIPYITPLLGAFGIILFYLILKKIFGRNVALVSAFLLAFFPPYFYYCARSMFHNIPFIVFLLAGLYAFFPPTGRDKSFYKPERERRGVYAVFETFILVARPVLAMFASGAFFGLAGITRTSELLWLLPVLVALVFFNLRRIKLAGLVGFIVGAFLFVLPALSWNYVLYGSFVSGGYPQMNSSISELQISGKDLVSSGVSAKIEAMWESALRLKRTIFHFGIDLEKSRMIAGYYILEMFPYLSILSVAGAVLFFARYKAVRKRHILYFSLILFLASILIVYYGSWEFYDNPDKSEHTIGNSYTRYWLPIYLGSIPFASYALIRISGFLGRFRIAGNVFLAGSVACLCFFSAIQVLIGSSEGLLQTAEKISSTKQEYELIIKNTESDSVVVTRYHDKLLFPERKVIVGDFGDPNMNSEYAKLSKMLPLYYYSFALTRKDLEYLNARKLGPLELFIEEKAKNGNFGLYSLEPL